MQPFLAGLLWGLLIAIIVVPIGAIVLWKYKQTKMRRQIKKLLNSGEILQPMDIKDYNVEGWKDKFPIAGLPEKMKELNEIFVKPSEEGTEEHLETIPDDSISGYDKETPEESPEEEPIEDLKEQKEVIHNE